MAGCFIAQFEELVPDGGLHEKLYFQRANGLPKNAIEPTFLPSIVRSLVLIKDLSLKWTDWQADWESQSSSNSASTSIGRGPFAVSGSYSHHDAQRDFTADASGESLKVPGIQLIGYVSMINPACPGVDSSQFLKKPGT
jgi:hypothetical protein